MLELAVHYRALKRYNEAKRVLENAGGRLDLQILRAEIDVAENADLTRLQNVLSSAPATADQNRLASKRGSVALLQRDYRAAAQALSAYRLPDFSGTGFVTPREYVEGVVAQGLGDAPKAEAAFLRARERAAAEVTARPDDAKALIVLAGIDAKLGRKEEAVREGERAVELLPVATDALDGPSMLVRLAAVYAEVRETIELSTFCSRPCRCLTVPATAISSLTKTSIPCGKIRASRKSSPRSRRRNRPVTKK